MFLVLKNQRPQIPPVSLFLCLLLTLGFHKYWSESCSSFSCNPLMFFWSPVGWGWGVFSNLMIKSQYFSEPLCLGCDLHECLSSGVHYSPLLPTHWGGTGSLEGLEWKECPSPSGMRLFPLGELAFRTLGGILQ